MFKEAYKNLPQDITKYSWIITVFDYLFIALLGFLTIPQYIIADGSFDTMQSN